MKSGTKFSSSNRVLRLNTSQCRREYKSGAVYHGELEGIKKSGRGIFKWPNGACYDGEYVDNTRHGYGKQHWPDGSIYEGTLMRDMRHGVGTLNWSDGESYVGGFYRDKKHGKGVYHWPDGTKFEGHFENDKKEGFGTFSFPSGNIFEGLYRRDERNGPGVMTYANNEQDVGLWSGQRLIKLCSVMDTAFLFQHFSNYNVNAGNNLSAKVRRANTAKEGTRNSRPSLQDCEADDNNKLLSQIPNSFSYSDILEGIRGDKGPKGPVERDSEEFLRAAGAGDCIKVRSLIESGSVHVDVADKTGYTALLAASVNCHRDVINCLLDNGANVNKLNDEGLSALAACHVLFYTKHTWKDNIAENIPDENLFNCIQEDQQKGIYVHRNYRQSLSVGGVVLEPNTESEDAEKNSEDEYLEFLIENETNEVKTNDQRKYRILEFSGRTVGDKDEKRGETVDNLNRTMRFKLQVDGKENRLVNTTNDHGTKRAVDGSIAYTKNEEMLAPFSGVLLCDKFGDKTSGQPKVIDPNLFSIMSVVSSTRQPSESADDVLSENSMDQSKQVLLAVQRRPHLEATVRLLLKRGADPNASALPMPVLFFAVKAADAAAVEILLQKGANTSAKLSKEQFGIAPLHIAVALPDDTGVEITKLLLKSGADPNIRDSAFDSEDNGRTPVHIACSREDNDIVSCAVVSLLLEHGANPDILCEGHSALSLAICSGNDMAVDTLLEHGANPSLSLSNGVGSALCAASSFMAERRRTPTERIKLINKLMRAGANILSPINVSVKYPPGTVVDYAYNVFYQDRKIAHTPYHALSATERDCYNARRDMLDHLGDLLRTQVLKKEKELIDKQIEEAEKLADEEKVKRTSLSALDVLKTPDKPSKLELNQSHTLAKNDGMRFSRVSFRLQNEVIAGDEIEAEADGEVKAILHSNNKDLGINKEKRRDLTSELSQTTEMSKTSTPSFISSAFEQSSEKPLSPGRDENCGLRIAVIKAADHMSISALATQALKQRQQVMKNRFRYCYECGRSISIRLSACTRCKEVFYCSKSCKLKAWNARHREECVRLTGGNKTASTHRAESPTPTTDPDDTRPHQATSSRPQRKMPSHGKVDKMCKVQASSSNACKRNNLSAATKVKK